MPQARKTARWSICVLVIIAAVAVAVGQSQPPQAGSVTLFEGARLIAGDGGAPIENSAFLVQNNRITQVGRKGQLKAPAGRRSRGSHRQDGDAGDRRHAHAHGDTRDALIDRLQRKAYLRCGGRHQPGTGCRRSGFPGSRGNHPRRRASANGRPRNHERRSPGEPRSRTGSRPKPRPAKRSQELAAKKGRHRQDLGR